MVSLDDVLLISVLVFGHAALWVAMFNRVHALPLPCRVINLLEKIHVLILVAGPMSAAWWILGGSGREARLSSQLLTQPLLAAYALVCAGMAVFIPVIWMIRKGTGPPSASALSNHTERLDVAAEVGHSLIGSRSAFILSKVPGNQVCKLFIHDKVLSHPRLPDALEGLTIAHLSDFHFTGKIKREYFEYVIERANALDADLVAVTGDIVDKDECIDWISSTLARLTSRLGVYFVLGNHDKRVSDVPALRATLRDAGLIDVAGRSLDLDVAGHRVALAGNELPWFGPAGELSDEQQDAETFRILLSHSPDQLKWARRRQFDLMLAGHTHGGQIRFPLIGPVVSPSLYGVKYACGIFYEAPTLLHVSRGLSGLDPIRLNCAPELAKLTLRRED